MNGEVLEIDGTRWKISFQKVTKKNKHGKKLEYEDLVATGSPNGRFRKIYLGKDVHGLLKVESAIQEYMEKKSG